jgi:hypothetical protein
LKKQKYIQQRCDTQISTPCPRLTSLALSTPKLKSLKHKTKKVVQNSADSALDIASIKSMKKFTGIDSSGSDSEESISVEIKSTIAGIKKRRKGSGWEGLNGPWVGGGRENVTPNPASNQTSRSNEFITKGGKDKPTQSLWNASKKTKILMAKGSIAKARKGGQQSLKDMMRR